MALSGILLANVRNVATCWHIKKAVLSVLPAGIRSARGGINKLYGSVCDKQKGLPQGSAVDLYWRWNQLECLGSG